MESIQESIPSADSDSDSDTDSIDTGIDSVGIVDQPASASKYYTVRLSDYQEHLDEKSAH